MAPLSVRSWNLRIHSTSAAALLVFAKCEHECHTHVCEPLCDTSVVFTVQTKTQPRLINLLMMLKINVRKYDLGT